MPDETVTIRYEADTTRYAAGARRVSQDLDKLAAKAARAEAAAARATRAEARRGITGAGRVAGMGGVSDLIGGAGSNPAISAALVAGYGVKKLLDDAKEADPAMAKLGDSIAKMVGPASQTTEALNRVNVALSGILGMLKNVFSTTLAKNITMATAALGALASYYSGVAKMLGMTNISKGLTGFSEDALASAYNDVTGGSGRGGVLEMEKKLSQAIERNKNKNKEREINTAATNNNVGDLGFQSSAGLYVTSGGAMMANQAITIQRNMLRQLQSITHATEQVTQAIRENSYGGQ